MLGFRVVSCACCWADVDGSWEGVLGSCSGSVTSSIVEGREVVKALVGCERSWGAGSLTREVGGGGGVGGGGVEGRTTAVVCWCCCC